MDLSGTYGNASIENIDSTRIENARFTFQGTGEEMKVLRMRILLRLKFQELLVVTEPGVTSVRIDSISSASGTPQNDALQHWKDRKQKTDGESYALWTALKTCSPGDSIRIKQTWDSLRVETQAFNYAFMKEHINQTVGKFLYKMIKTSLTEEQRKELDEANLLNRICRSRLAVLAIAMLRFLLLDVPLSFVPQRANDAVLVQR